MPNPIPPSSTSSANYNLFSTHTSVPTSNPSSSDNLNPFKDPSDSHFTNLPSHSSSSNSASVQNNPFLFLNNSPTNINQTANTENWQSFFNSPISLPSDSHRFNIHNTPQKKSEALERLKVVANQMYPGEPFSRKVAERLFYALNGRPATQDPNEIPDEFKLFYPEHAYDLALLSPKEITVTPEQWKRIKHFRTDRLEAIDQEIEDGFLTSGQRDAVKKAFEESEKTIKEDQKGNLNFENFRCVLGELSFIMDLKEGEKPMTDYYIIDDNSGSMLDKGSILSIPKADLDFITSIRQTLKSLPYSRHIGLFSTQDGLSLFQANRIEEQFLSELTNFRLVKAAVGDRLAGQDDYDPENNDALKPQARQEGKLAYYIVPLNAVLGWKNVTENCVHKEGRGSSAQYELKKRYPIDSEKALVKSYQEQYRDVGGTPLASVTNAVVREIKTRKGNDPNARAMLVIKTDGDETGDAIYSGHSRQKHEVINEVLDPVLQGVMKVSLHPMTDEGDESLLKGQNLLAAMRTKQAQLKRAQIKESEDKHQLTKAKGKVDSEFMRSEDGEKIEGAAWMDRLDSVTPAGTVDCNDDLFTEILQSVERDIYSLPMKTPEDCDKADRLWSQFCQIKQQFSELTQRNWMTHELSQRWQDINEKLVALQQAIKGEPGARTSSFSKSVKMAAVTQYSDAEDDFHLKMVTQKIQEYENAMATYPDDPPPYSTSNFSKSGIASSGIDSKGGHKENTETTTESSNLKPSSSSGKPKKKGLFLWFKSKNK